jgi:ABC-type phosphate transport system auxiliary subunit
VEQVHRVLRRQLSGAQITFEVAPKTMATTTKPQRPEDAELSKKQSELGELQSRLADLELQLLTLHLELDEFENLYHKKVGPLYAELDEVEAQIAEQQAKREPLNRKAAEAASNARSKAEESRRVVDAVLTQPPPIARSQTLKDLYRTAAKRLHPDLARDETDRAIRERLMTEANLAYERGDEARLREILEEYDSNPDLVVGSDIGAELVRTIRRISLVSSKIKKIEQEINDLNSSELAKLRATVNEGNRTGKDVLGQLAEKLKRRIQERRQFLTSL